MIQIFIIGFQFKDGESKHLSFNGGNFIFRIVNSRFKVSFVFIKTRDFLIESELFSLMRDEIRLNFFRNRLHFLLIFLFDILQFFVIFIFDISDVFFQTQSLFYEFFIHSLRLFNDLMNKHDVFIPSGVEEIDLALGVFVLSQQLRQFEFVGVVDFLFAGDLDVGLDFWGVLLVMHEIQEEKVLVGAAILEVLVRFVQNIGDIFQNVQLIKTFRFLAETFVVSVRLYAPHVVPSETLVEIAVVEVNGFLFRQNEAVLLRGLTHSLFHFVLR